MNPAERAAFDTLVALIERGLAMQASDAVVNDVLVDRYVADMRAALVTATAVLAIDALPEEPAQPSRRFRTQREEIAWVKFVAPVFGACESSTDGKTEPATMARYAAERADALVLEFRARALPSGPQPSQIDQSKARAREEALRYAVRRIRRAGEGETAETMAALRELADEFERELRAETT